jgi:HPr kinase/phosphorylase
MSAVLVHATCVVLDDAGILLQGPSGAGKSTLAGMLISRWHQKGRFARLVGDDRIALDQKSGRLLARSHPVVAGQLEIRSLGIISIAFEPAAVVRAVIEFVPEMPERMPDVAALACGLMGVCLPCLRMVPRNESVDLIETFLTHANVRIA